MRLISFNATLSSAEIPDGVLQEIIQTYLWPALLEGKDGPCVQKGVVVT